MQAYTRAQILWSGGVWPPNESVNSLMNGFCRECRAQWEATERNWILGRGKTHLIWPLLLITKYTTSDLLDPFSDTLVCTPLEPLGILVEYSI